ncbi:hypothetical protein [Streptococcus hyovaginalis]|uniref:hypothetical protein n=1 Tax=Streptococcus hyovaginalis TaxID=149015 RepID=UPI003B3AC955
MKVSNKLKLVGIVVACLTVLVTGYFVKKSQGNIEGTWITSSQDDPNNVGGKYVLSSDGETYKITYKYTGTTGFFVLKEETQSVELLSGKVDSFSKELTVSHVGEEFEEAFSAGEKFKYDKKKNTVNIKKIADGEDLSFKKK